MPVAAVKTSAVRPATVRPATELRRKALPFGGSRVGPGGDQHRATHRPGDGGQLLTDGGSWPAGGRWGSGPTLWNQEHRRRPHHLAEESGRVYVGGADPGSEVERLTGGADHLPTSDPLPHLDGDGPQERIRRPDSVGMEDGHVKGAANLAGEHHQPGTDGAYWSARGRLVLQPPVTGQPRLIGGSERIDHRGVNRRLVTGRAISRGRNRCRDQALDQNQEGTKQTDHPSTGSRPDGTSRPVPSHQPSRSIGLSAQPKARLRRVRAGPPGGGS